MNGSKINKSKYKRCFQEVKCQTIKIESAIEFMDPNFTKMIINYFFFHIIYHF